MFNPAAIYATHSETICLLPNTLWEKRKTNSLFLWEMVRVRA
jgi:hypothetical protein